MSKRKGVNGLFAALLVVLGCAGPTEPDGVGSGNGSGIGDIDANDVVDEPGEWTAYTSEEYPALSCPNGYAVQGVDCDGSFCDNIALYCAFTGWDTGATKWLPYFSEEGSGSADEGRCVGDDVWMTGLGCKGGFCDQISMQCTQMLGSSTGACAWTGWRSEEQAPYYAPVGDYIKAIECDGPFCDRKRYRHCEMY
jgi:hypothetical protein